jgi:selenocysteine lyase/cysteine desulfurase
MGVSRRAVLGGAGAIGAIGTAGLTRACSPGRGAAGDGQSTRPEPSLDPSSWESVRAQFPLAAGHAQFAAFVFASHPAPVRAAIEAHRAGLDRDPIGYLEENNERLETAVAEAAAGYLETEVDRIAFTDSTTMGLGLLYGGLRLRGGDEILTTEHDFYSTHEALRLREVADGARVRKVRLYDSAATATPDGIVDRLLAAVTARTRVVAVTWVHSGTGVKLPIRAIADALRGRAERPLLCVDGVHGFGAEDATPEALGVDFLVSGCHKWLFGPRGTGLVWGSTDGWARYAPAIPPFDGRAIGAWLGVNAPPLPPGPGATPGGYHSFEHRWALAEAFAFHRAIGRPRIAGRVRELATRLKAGLDAAGARLVTPKDPELSAGIVCVDLPGKNPAEVVQRLRDQRVIASTTPYDPSYVRFGTSIATGDQDVDAAVKALRAL